ncbi:MAG: hypothetical protein ACOYN6_13195 [Ignavibacteria bacterium]
MKKLFYKILILLIPVIIYLVFVLVVDPFNYFGISDFIPLNIKRSVAYIENPALFNLIHFNRNPSENITISDSRFADKDLPLIESQTGFKFAELYIFDGMIKDMISGFWFANSRVKLKNVYLSINFNNFFITQRNDLVKSAETIINDPLMYAANLNIIKSAFKCLKYDNNSAKDTIYKIPRTDFESNWTRFLSVTEMRYYKNYSYPQEYLKDLKEIKSYCDKHSINLCFIIPPTNVDMQNLIDSNNLKSQKEMFVRNLAKISATYDMDFPNTLTYNRELFYDPVHIDKADLTRLFISIVNNRVNNDSAFIKEYKLKDN